MQHLDEGTIHAWLDGALTFEEGARVELHLASCEACAEAVAEARGLIAASSRILTALDDVPRVQGAQRAQGAQGAQGAWLVRWRIAAVVALVAAGGALTVAIRRGPVSSFQVPLAAERVSDLELAAADTPAEQAAVTNEEPPRVESMRDGRALGAVGARAAAPGLARERDLAAPPQAAAPTPPPANEGYVASAAKAAPPARTDDTVRVGPIVTAGRAERQQVADASPSLTEKLSGALGARRSAAEAPARFAEPREVEQRLNRAALNTETPRPLTEERMMEDGRIVVRRIYRIEGMLVTLDERPPIADKDVLQERVRRLDVPLAAQAPRDSTTTPVTSVRWVDARGTEFTLSGSAPEAQLERIRKVLGF